MITRYWRGLTKPVNAEAYERFLRSQLLPELEAIPGFDGGYVLRRDVPKGVEFVTLTRFASLEALRAFAGADYERAVIRPQAELLLEEAEETALHYETVVDTVNETRT
jgi:heme-degrading monooxygenase HmoA